jgi:hypothetical protein
MKVTMLLADSVQAVGGKLYILGGGWSVTGPPAQFGIAILIEIPWDQTNQKHPWKLELLDSDGAAVLVQTPAGEQPLVFQGELEVGRPPGLKPGTPIGIPLAINLAPLQLEPSSRYEWRLSIHGQTDENWRVTFSTRSAEEQRKLGGQPPGQGS